MPNTPKQNLLEFVEKLRETNPEMADEVLEMGKKYAADQNQDIVKITVKPTFILEKFHGEKKPGDKPYEVIEGTW